MLSHFFGIDLWKFESEPDDSTTSNRFDCEEGDKLLEQVSAIAATLLCGESSDRVCECFSNMVKLLLSLQTQFDFKNIMMLLDMTC